MQPHSFSSLTASAARGRRSLARFYQVSICLSLLVSGLGPDKASASDWGYDGMDAPPAPARRASTPGVPVPIVVEEKSAASLTKSLLKPEKAAQKGSLSGLQIKPSKGAATGAGASSGSSPGLQSGGGPLNKGLRFPGSGALQAVPGSAEANGSKGKQVAAAGIQSNRAKPAGSDPADSYVDKDMQAARCWLQLFQACSKQTLDYGEQKQMEAYVLGRERQGGKAKEEMRSVLAFWPKLINDLRNHPDMEMYYADLFKALLRLHERSCLEKTNVEASPFTNDADLISHLLGLQRTAVDGDPAFTEDAVNAYADMAVFIYEQRHAGRTIDASDNRTLFAKVVVEKFKTAPTDADKRAMSSFDLAWAKFKIIWFSSNEKTRQELLEKLVKTGANSTLSAAKDPLLDLVLSSWPWKTNP